MSLGALWRDSGGVFYGVDKYLVEPQKTASSAAGDVGFCSPRFDIGRRGFGKRLR